MLPASASPGSSPSCVSLSSLSTNSPSLSPPGDATSARLAVRSQDCAKNSAHTPKIARRIVQRLDCFSIYLFLIEDLLKIRRFPAHRLLIVREPTFHRIGRASCRERV